MNVAATFTIDDVCIVASVFGTIINCPCSCSASAMEQLHDPILQSYFSTMLSNVSVDSIINVLDVFLLTFYNHNYAVEASAILALAMHIKTTINM